jgi:hypothetical protein
LLSAALGVSEQALRKNPAVLRELAAELGASHPVFLRLAGDVLLEELLNGLSKDHPVAEGVTNPTTLLLFSKHSCSSCRSQKDRGPALRASPG